MVNEGSDNVSAHRIGSDGGLTSVPGSPFAAGSDPHKMVVDPAGRFAYVANEASKNVSAYGIGPNGGLTPIPGSPFLAGIGPYAVAVDPTGNFVYVANKGVPH